MSRTYSITVGSIAPKVAGLTDTAGLADTVALTAVGGRGQSDMAGLADTVAAAVASAGAQLLADSAVAADALTVAMAGARAQTDTTGLADSTTIGLSGAPVWPAATNTPSVSGSTLTYYPNFPTNSTPSTTTLTLHSGDLETTSNGQVIADLEITGSVIIKHNDVRISRCWVHNWSIFGIYAEDGAFTTGHPAIIEDCLVSAPTVGSGATSITNSNFTIRRSRIRDAENGFDLGHDALIEYCYVYPLYNGGAAHADGIQTQSGGPASNITVQHNTIFCRGPDDGGTETNGTSCMICAIGTTSFTDVTINHNFFAGGAFSLYGPQSQTGTRVKITDNHFGTNYGSLVGEFGPWVDATDESVVTGNIKVDASDNFISTLP